MLIAGLGNPGREYEYTRHNAGFWAANAIASHFRVEFEQSRYRALISKFQFNEQSHLLVKPMTYMNLSGEVISELMLEHSIPSSELLVLADDINIPTGRIRIRPSGSDGGHNGLRSIISHTGTNFWRLRIGVGQPLPSDLKGHESLISHVLGNISNNETKIFEKILSEISKIIALWLMGMGNRAMTSYNGLDFLAPFSDSDIGE